jgi:hypothetical protein
VIPGSRQISGCRLTAIVTLASLCALLPATGLAAQAPSAQSAAPAQATGEQGHPEYDPSTEATFTGTVEDVRGGPGRLSWLMRAHTLGLGHKSADTRAVLLNTGTDTVRIVLGPAAFLRDRKIDLKKGDHLTVTGSAVTIDESHLVLAREIRRGESSWTIRTAAGQPLWSAAAGETRRFWTKTKTVMVVVAAKVALLATVLQH